MHRGFEIAIRVVITTTTGMVGSLGGGFLGLAFARLITGRGELHGFDTIALVFLFGGCVAGLVAGTKLGSILARRLR